MRWQKFGIALIVCLALSLIQYFVLFYFGVFWFILMMILMTSLAKISRHGCFPRSMVLPKPVTRDLKVIQPREGTRRICERRKALDESNGLMPINRSKLF
jgi:hypothetical protein